MEWVVIELRSSRLDHIPLFSKLENIATLSGKVLLGRVYRFYWDNLWRANS